MELFPAKRSNQLDAQIVLCVVSPVQKGLIGDDIQLGPLIHMETHQGLVGDEQVQHILLKVVVQQYGAHVGDVAVRHWLLAGPTSG